MHRDHVGALCLGIAGPHKNLYARAYGTTAANAQFPIASITKSFTAVAILLLASARVLSLDDPVGKFVPEFAPARNIPLRELVNQTSGLPDYAQQSSFAQWRQTARSPFEVLAHIASRVPDFPAGTNWAYSNTNYLLLGLTVARASGMPYERYVQSHLLLPLGLRATHFAGDAAQFGTASIVSNIFDVMRWDQAVFANEILPPPLSQTLFSAATLPDGRQTGYGFGYFLRGMDGVVVFGQSGNVNGYSSDNETIVASQTHIVLLAKANTLDLLPLTKSIVQIIALAPPHRP